MKSAIQRIVSEMREAEYLTQVDINWVEKFLIDFCAGEERTEEPLAVEPTDKFVKKIAYAYEVDGFVVRNICDHFQREYGTISNGPRKSKI